MTSLKKTKIGELYYFDLWSISDRKATEILQWADNNIPDYGYQSGYLVIINEFDLVLFELTWY